MADAAQAPSRRPWRFNAWYATAIILAVIAALDTAQFVPTVEFAAKAIANTAPFILFAVLAVAYLKATGAESVLAKAFEGSPGRMILTAAAFAGLPSAYSTLTRTSRWKAPS